jgi:hypothetical protein
MLCFKFELTISFKEFHSTSNKLNAVWPQIMFLTLKCSHEKFSLENN